VRGTRLDAAGLRQLQRDIATISKEANRNAVRELKTAAEPTKDEAARRAPRGKDPVRASRKTVRGTRSRLRLHQSLKVSVTRGRVSIRSPLAHAKIVNDGGRHPVFGNRERWVQVQPRPFIAQAVRANQARMLEDLADATERLILRNGFHR
jgi:hypothetical protein